MTDEQQARQDRAARVLGIADHRSQLPFQAIGDALLSRVGIALGPAEPEVRSRTAYLTAELLVEHGLNHWTEIIATIVPDTVQTPMGWQRRLLVGQMLTAYRAADEAYGPEG